MSTNNHYSQHLSHETLRELSTQLRIKFPQGANSYQLAPLDQLHLGGIKASEKLVDRIEQLQPKRILEIGSGAGGLERLVQQRCSIDYVAIDITHLLNCLNQQLNNQHQANFDGKILTADAHHLPIADDCIDLIIMQHIFLNIPDKDQVLRECQRILTPQGHILMHEVVEGSHPERLQFPVPWASNSNQSHLQSLEALQQQFYTHNAKHIEVSDWTDEALSWRARQSQKESPSNNKADKSSPTIQLNPKVIFGAEFKAMGLNLQTNLAAQAIRIVEMLIKF